MTLSKQEKKRIREEERVRAQARRQSKNKSVKQIGCFFLGLPFVIGFIYATYNTMSDKPVGLETNVGKTACNAETGECAGEIVGVRPCRVLPQATCYVIDKTLPNGEEMEIPVEITNVQ